MLPGVRENKEKQFFGLKKKPVFLSVSRCKMECRAVVTWNSPYLSILLYFSLPLPTTASFVGLSPLETIFLTTNL